MCSQVAEVIGGDLAVDEPEALLPGEFHEVSQRYLGGFGFMMEHGGEVLKYSSITMEHLNTGMAKHGMDGMDGMDH